jgi:poly [ADP-ribose] polymerase
MGFKAVLNPYLSLIPQKGLVRQLDFPSMFSISGGLQRQTDILDGLESSYATVIAAAQKDNGKVVESVQEEKLFRVKLEVATGKDFDNIKKYYNDTKGSHYDVQSYDVKQVWLLVIEHMAEAFNKDGAKLQNIWTLWHGSSACNYLSILKAGMIVPRGGGSIRITGRLFSDGLYFSDQSTKSIRYATGAWGGAGVKDRKFMLINNVAMGKYHVPRGSQYSYRLPSGYDSCFAKAGESGVQNNEMVVYRTSVVNPTHLVEFTPYGK